MPIRRELANLHKLLASFDGGEMIVREGGADVTKREADILRREIEYLEAVLARVIDGGSNA